MKNCEHKRTQSVSANIIQCLDCKTMLEFAITWSFPPPFLTCG